LRVKRALGLAVAVVAASSALACQGLIGLSDYSENGGDDASSQADGSMESSTDAYGNGDVGIQRDAHPDTDSGDAPSLTEGGLPDASDGGAAEDGGTEAGDATTVDVVDSGGPGDATTADVVDSGSTNGPDSGPACTTTCVGESSGAIAIHPNGKFVYAASGTSGLLTVLSVNTNGSLTQASGTGSAVAAGSFAEAVVIDPTGKFLYSVDSANTSLYAYTIGTNGLLTTVSGSPFTIGAACGFAHIDSAGANLYVSCRNSFNLYVFSIDPTSGALANTSGSPVDVGIIQSHGVGNEDFVVDPGGFFYLVNDNSGNPGNVFGVALSSPFSLASTLPGSPTASSGTNPTAAVESPISNRYLYVANPVSNDIAGFSVDRSSGALTALTSSPFGVSGINSGPHTSLVEDSSESVVAVACGNGVSVLTVGSSGGLSATSSQSGYVTGVAIDANTKFLYANESSSVQVFGLSAGMLTSLGTTGLK
jgi:hypothetical protein